MQQKNEKEATAKEEAEAAKIKDLAAAEADAESKLAGEGIAQQRI